MRLANKIPKYLTSSSSRRAVRQCEVHNIYIILAYVVFAYVKSYTIKLSVPDFSLSTITISSSNPTQFRRSSHSASLPSSCSGRTSTLMPPNRLVDRPSSSHTRISSPILLTLTALPREVISASLMPEVWPQRRMLGDIVSDDVVDLQSHRTSVLSGRAARR